MFVLIESVQVLSVLSEFFFFFYCLTVSKIVKRNVCYIFISWGCFSIFSIQILVPFTVNKTGSDDTDFSKNKPY